MNDLSADVTSPFLLNAVCKYENQAKKGDGVSACNVEQSGMSDDFRCDAILQGSQPEIRQSNCKGLQAALKLTRSKYHPMLTMTKVRTMRNA